VSNQCKVSISYNIAGIIKLNVTKVAGNLLDGDEWLAFAFYGTDKYVILVQKYHIGIWTIHVLVQVHSDFTVHILYAKNNTDENVNVILYYGIEKDIQDVKLIRRSVPRLLQLNC
jgi:hypothetical protein